jgi:hypothetical protein
MRERQRLASHPLIEAAIAEIEGLIRTAYPNASFDVVQGDDPEGLYLIATVDAANHDDVIDCYVERLLELQIEDELPLYVVPVRPLDRVLTDQHTNPPRASALAD